jgi:hypothetical protein
VRFTDVYRSMPFNRLIVIVLLLLFAKAASAQDPNVGTIHVFPVVVDGRQADGSSYRTSLVLQNSSFSTISCWIGFQGSAPAMTAPDGTIATGGLIQQFLPPGSFDLLRSNGTGPLTSGYAWISCSQPVTAYEVLSSYAGVAGEPPRLISETTVTSTPSATSIQFINDGREQGNLALSLANDNWSPTFVRVQVFDLYGRFLTSVQLVVGARTSFGRFLSEIVSGLPPKHVGIVRVESSLLIYATGLRFTGPILTAVPSSLSGFVR